MYRSMLKSKIHRARVTEADLHYVGSVTIDQDLLAAADILPNEKVLVVNLNNGARFETYAFEGASGSGVVCMNGGCARHVQIGDTVLILAFGWVEDAAAKHVKPKVIFVDEENRVSAKLEPAEEAPKALPKPPPKSPPTSSLKSLKKSPPRST